MSNLLHRIINLHRVNALITFDELNSLCKAEALALVAKAEFEFSDKKYFCAFLYDQGLAGRAAYFPNEHNFSIEDCLCFVVEGAYKDLFGDATLKLD